MPMTEPRRAGLVLQDGTRFEGLLHGDAGALGEVVFTTAMTGYGEIATDPSYAGQIVVLTFPEIGIYGVAPDQMEGDRPRPTAIVVRRLCGQPSHPSAQLDFERFLGAAGVPILTEVDTRALTRHLRSRGTMPGQIAEGALGSVPDVSCQLVREVATRTPYWYRREGDGPLVGVVDFGTKEDILRQLAGQGARLLVLPPDVRAGEVEEAGVDGIVLTNGPGDPADMPEYARLARELAERHPTLGICLGHQLLALGYGARTFKLPFGHRGSNHPVDHDDGRPGEVTSQNHGYAVDAQSLTGTPLEVTEQHLSDGTVEGLRHRTRPVISVQYHPEAGPGPWEARDLFQIFVDSLRRDA